MSIKLGKMEINLYGTVGVLGPNLVAIGAGLGFVVWEQRTVTSRPSYQCYEVDRQESNFAPLAIGIIVIEQLSKENVLMTFGTVSDWLEAEPVRAEYVEMFWDFIDAPLRQLVGMGYVKPFDMKAHYPNDTTHPVGSDY